MLTKYLLNISRIRATLGYQLFIAKHDTSQTPWVYLAWISKYLSLWLLLSLFSCLCLGVGIAATYFKVMYWWSWVVPNLFLLILFTFCFSVFQKKGNQIYHQFMQAVELRHQTEKDTHISPENSKILYQYLFKLQSVWLKVAALLIILPLLALAVYHYQVYSQSKLLSSKPSQALQKLIIQKKTKIQLWQQYLNDTQQRIKAAQKQYAKAYTQLKQAEAALQSQFSALVQSQVQRRNLEVFFQSVNKASNLAAKESLIKADALMYAQLKGALEAQLALKDQDEAQAAVLLTQEGKLYETLQGLLARQDYSLSKAQNALNQERTQKIELEKKVRKSKQLLTTLLHLEDQYCHQKQKSEQDLVQLQKKYQLFLVKEKHY